MNEVKAWIRSDLLTYFRTRPRPQSFQPAGISHVQFVNFVSSPPSGHNDGSIFLYVSDTEIRIPVHLTPKAQSDLYLAFPRLAPLSLLHRGVILRLVGPIFVVTSTAVLLRPSSIELVGGAYDQPIYRQSHLVAPETHSDLVPFLYQGGGIIGTRRESGLGSLTRVTRVVHVSNGNGRDSDSASPSGSDSGYGRPIKSWDDVVPFDEENEEEEEEEPVPQVSLPVSVPVPVPAGPITVSLSSSRVAVPIPMAIALPEPILNSRTVPLPVSARPTATDAAESMIEDSGGDADSSGGTSSPPTSDSELSLSIPAAQSIPPFRPMSSEWSEDEERQPSLVTTEPSLTEPTSSEHIDEPPPNTDESFHSLPAAQSTPILHRTIDSGSYSRSPSCSSAEEDSRSPSPQPNPPLRPPSSLTSEPFTQPADVPFDEGDSQVPPEGDLSSPEEVSGPTSSQLFREVEASAPTRRVTRKRKRGVGTRRPTKRRKLATYTRRPRSKSPEVDSPPRRAEGVGSDRSGHRRGPHERSRSMSPEVQFSSRPVRGPGRGQVSRPAQVVPPPPPDKFVQTEVVHSGGVDQVVQTLPQTRGHRSVVVQTLPQGRRQSVQTLPQSQSHRSVQTRLRERLVPRRVGRVRIWPRNPRFKKTSSYFAYRRAVLFGKGSKK